MKRILVSMFLLVFSICLSGCEIIVEYASLSSITKDEEFTSAYIASVNGDAEVLFVDFNDLKQKDFYENIMNSSARPTDVLPEEIPTCSLVIKSDDNTLYIDCMSDLYAQHNDQWYLIKCAKEDLNALKEYLFPNDEQTYKLTIKNNSKIDLIGIKDEYKAGEEVEVKMEYDMAVETYVFLNGELLGTLNGSNSLKFDMPAKNSVLVIDYLNVVPTNHFLRNQLGCEWLNEINVNDIIELKIITEGVGVAPGTFKDISSSTQKEVISRIFEEYYWLDTSVSKKDCLLDGGGSITVKFFLKNGTIKNIYIINGHYKDSNGDYYELFYIPKFNEDDNYVNCYGFITYEGHAQIYNNSDKAICSIPMNEIEFMKVYDEIVLDGKPVTHYVETEFGKLYFVSETYFYIDGIVEGDIFNDELKPIYYQLVSKNLDDLIYEYSVVPE